MRDAQDNRRAVSTGEEAHVRAGSDDPEPGGDDAVEGIELSPAAFEVSDVKTANWLVRRIVECRRYEEQVKTWADAEARRAQREEHGLLQRFGGQLEVWLRRALHEQGARRRSISLPAGVAALRARPARLDVLDEAALASWCRRHLPEALNLRIEAVGGEAVALEEWAKAHCTESRRSMTVARSTICSHFAATAELPDGTAVLPRHDVLVIK